MARVEVWFSGDDTLEGRFPTLEIRKRSPTVGNWQHFDSRFCIDDPRQLDAAVGLLTLVSGMVVINVEDRDLTDDEIDRVFAQTNCELEWSQRTARRRLFDNGADRPESIN